MNFRNKSLNKSLNKSTRGVFQVGLHFLSFFRKVWKTLPWKSYRLESFLCFIEWDTVCLSSISTFRYLWFLVEGALFKTKTVLSTNVRLETGCIVRKPSDFCPNSVQTFLWLTLSSRMHKIWPIRDWLHCPKTVQTFYPKSVQSVFWFASFSACATLSESKKNNFGQILSVFVRFLSVFCLFYGGFTEM